MQAFNIEYFIRSRTLFYPEIRWHGIMLRMGAVHKENLIFGKFFIFELVVLFNKLAEN